MMLKSMLLIFSDIFFLFFFSKEIRPFFPDEMSTGSAASGDGGACSLCFMIHLLLPALSYIIFFCTGLKSETDNAEVDASVPFCFLFEKR